MNPNKSKVKTSGLSEKRSGTGKRSPTPAKKESEPEYMVQVSDPKMVRKDILESLREMIIFMQGYEQFRKIQEEKVALFAYLRNDIKELHILINTKLRKYLPQGKLRGILSKEAFNKLVDKEEDILSGVSVVDIKQSPKKQSAPVVSTYSSRSELDELESQLKDIENQLRNIN